MPDSIPGAGLYGSLNLYCCPCEFFIFVFDFIIIVLCLTFKFSCTILSVGMYDWVDLSSH